MHWTRESDERADRHWAALCYHAEIPITRVVPDPNDAPQHEEPPRGGAVVWALCVVVLAVCLVGLALN